MGVPVVYRRSGEAALASYDYVDVAQGTGYITFYGALDQTPAGVLTTGVIYSDKIESAVNITSSSYVKEIDQDFDVVLNVPLTVRGLAIFSNPFMLYHNEANANSYGYLVVRLRKWDGTTETEIANATSAVMNIATNGAGAITTQDHDKMIMTRFTVPATSYKKGETLRVTIEGWAKTNATTLNKKVLIGHDPKNRVSSILPTVAYTFSGSEVTQFIARIPVKIDL